MTSERGLRSSFPPSRERARRLQPSVRLRAARRRARLRSGGARRLTRVYPRDFTFICPTELQAFAELAPEFEAAETHVVAASADRYRSHKAWFESHLALGEVRYPIVAGLAA